MIDDDLKAKASSFALALKELNISQAEIYIDDFNDFKIAFFGALMADVKPILLPKPEFSKDFFTIDKDSFLNLMSKDLKGSLNLSKKSEFYLKSSGSSGKSKNIKKTLKQMYDEARFLANELGFSASDRFVASVSHQHMFGLGFKLFLPLALGASVEKDELKYIEKIFNTNLDNAVFITSPVLLRAILRDKSAYKISKLKAIITAGSPLDLKTRNEIKSLGVDRIINIYGSSETGVIARDVGDGFEIFKAVNASVINGEFVVSSPWCESFKSSDIVSISGNKLSVFGRSDRVVKLNDRRINLEQVDEALLNSDLVSDAYCAIIDGFSRACCIIRLSERGIKEFRKSGKRGVLSIIKSSLNKEFAAAIRHFRFVDTMPRNQQSKISKDDFAKAFKSSNKPRFEMILSDGESFKFKAHISVGFDIFAKHFLDFAVVPGFMQLEFVYDLASSIGILVDDSPLLENIKFTSFLRPNDEVFVTLIPKNDKLYFEIFANDKKCASGRIVRKNNV